MADMAAGGIELKKTDAVSMESEDLYLSKDRIEVRYDFRNRSKKDVHATVAFPIPSFKLGNSYGGGYVAEPFGDFSVWCDDQVVDTRRTVRIFGLDDAEEKNDLSKLMSRYFTNPASAERSESEANSLPKADRAALIKRGLLSALDEHEAIANWKAQITYTWKQVFPAGKVVRIRHSYKPVRGGTTSCMSESCLDDGKFCVSEGGVLDWVARRKKEGGYVQAEWIEYILATGANWSGPIRDFHLTIEKPDKDTRVSLCFDGIKKTGPTTFEARVKNFTPSRDLAVLFLK